MTCYLIDGHVFTEPPLLALLIGVYIVLEGDQIL